MEGVPEEAARQQGLVDDEQAVIEGRIADARDALEAALDERLADSMAFVDALVARLDSELGDADAGAIDAVDAARQDAEQAIDDLRTQLLWDIKELVFRLGYTQGYHYGAHDGLDLEIQ